MAYHRWRRALALGLLLLSFLLLSCGVDDEVVGEATIAITTVPTGVMCLSIVVTGSRVATKTFDVTEGQSTVLYGRLDLINSGGYQSGNADGTFSAMTSMFDQITFGMVADDFGNLNGPANVAVLRNTSY